MIRLSRTLPEGWTLVRPDPTTSLPEIARATNGAITVRIRWPVPADDHAIEPHRFRAIATAAQPTPDDWILSAIDGDEPIPLPEEIRDWAMREVRHLYSAFKDLD